MYLFVILLLMLGTESAHAQSVSSVQTYFTDPTDCSTDATIATKARITTRCLDMDDFTEWMCANPTGGASSTFCDRAVEWSRIGPRICADATNVRANITNAILGEECGQLDGSGLSYRCVRPADSGDTTFCDQVGEWDLSGDGQTTNTLQDVCDGACQIGSAVSEGSALIIGNTTLSKFWKLWCDSGGCVMKATPAQDMNVSIATGTEFNFYKNDGTTLLGSMTEAGVWSMTSATTVDMGSALATTSSKIGTTPPATCTVGQVFFDTNDAAGTNWKGCTATNTWTTLGASGSVTAPLTLTAATDGVGTLIIRNVAAAEVLRFGTLPADATAGTIWGSVGTPSATNYMLSSGASGANTNVNALTNLYMATAGTVRGLWDSGGLKMNGGLNWPYGGGDVGINRRAAGILEINPTTVFVGTTVANARHLLMGRLQLAEQTTMPTAAELSIAGSNTLDTAHIFIANNKFVVAFNNAGTVTYLSIPLNGSATTWTQNTTTP